MAVFLYACRNQKKPWGTPDHLYHCVRRHHHLERFSGMEHVMQKNMQHQKHTADGRNPKQPLEMYKTLQNNGIFTISPSAGLLPARVSNCNIKYDIDMTKTVIK